MWNWPQTSGEEAWRALVRPQSGTNCKESADTLDNRLIFSATETRLLSRLCVRLPSSSAGWCVWAAQGKGIRATPFSIMKLHSFLCIVNLDLFSLCCVLSLLIQRVARGIFSLGGCRVNPPLSEEKGKAKSCPFLAVNSQHQVIAVATGVRTALLPPPLLFAVFHYETIRMDVM